MVMRSAPASALISAAGSEPSGRHEAGIMMVAKEWRVVKVHVLHCEHAGVGVRSERGCGRHVEVHNPSGEWRKEVNLGLRASLVLNLAEGQREVARYAMVSLEDLRGANALVGRCQLDEDAGAGDGEVVFVPEAAVSKLSLMSTSVETKPG